MGTKERQGLFMWIPKQYPYILIAEEKDDTRYFVLNSKEDLFKVCLKLLKERATLGYWYNQDEPTSPPGIPPYTKEEMEGLKGKAKEGAMEEWLTYNSYLREYEIQKQLATDIKKALKEKNGELAFRVLDARGYEYEQIKLERPENA